VKATDDGLRAVGATFGYTTVSETFKDAGKPPV